ncbi:MAG: histidine phosphatase family protein [Actinomycetota bacterium]
MTSILIVRHGQSVWNAQGRWQGRADPPLSDLGHRQARVAAASLPRFDVLVASTLQRAHQTAHGISEVTGVAPVRLDRRLMERDAGGFSGLTRGEIDDQFPGYLAQGRWPDGWEDDATLVDRVRAGLDDLVEAHRGQTIVVVSHGGVIYALEASLGIPHRRISNLAGRWFGLVDGHLTTTDRVHLLDAADETVNDQL